MDSGSELGFHRGGFSGMDFDSLMVVDMWVWVRAKRAVPGIRPQLELRYLYGLR